MKLMASTLLVVTMATGALAQSRADISRDCLNLVEAGDIAAASVLVDRIILNKNRALSAQTEAYELKCINAVKDEHYAMDTVQGGYATLSALKAQSAAKRKNKREERKKKLKARKDAKAQARRAKEEAEEPAELQ